MKLNFCLGYSLNIFFIKNIISLNIILIIKCLKYFFIFLILFYILKNIIINSLIIYWPVAVLAAAVKRVWEENKTAMDRNRTDVLSVVKKETDCLLLSDL